MFDQMDSNKDGVLDRDEFAAAMCADDSLAAALTTGGGSNLDAATAAELEKFNELVRHSLFYTCTFGVRALVYGTCCLLIRRQRQKYVLTHTLTITCTCACCCDGIYGAQDCKIILMLIL